ncbi:MAG TPA: Rad52/Rad22 family DNA repair protein [Terriglobales bacterium]
MRTEDKTTSPSGLKVNKLLPELEVPFSPDQVRWRVTNTTNDKKRGQIVPYADSRAYTDRLNALFTPQGWTREYKVETMTNITRIKKGESILSGKVLVTCTVTILGIGSHSGTGEEWADDDNGMILSRRAGIQAGVFLRWARPLLLRHSANLGRSGPEPPACQNTGVIGLGAAGELAQGDAAAGQEPDRKCQRTEPWRWFERGQQRQPWPGYEKPSSANRWRRERSCPNRKV